MHRRNFLVKFFLTNTIYETIKLFQNTVANPSQNPERLLAFLAAMGLSTISSCQDSRTQQNSVQAGAQIGTGNARVISLRKTVKYCTHCKQDYHFVDECRVKYLHLIPTSSSPEPTSERRRRGGNNNKKADEAKDNDIAYFAANELIFFIANNSSTSFCASNTWV